MLTLLSKTNLQWFWQLGLSLTFWCFFGSLWKKKVPFLQVFFRLGNECISSSSVIFFHFALVMLAWWSFPDGETTVSCRDGESPFSACYLQLLLYDGLKTQRSLAFALLSFKSFPAYDELLLSKNLKKHLYFTYFLNGYWVQNLYFLCSLFF